MSIAENIHQVQQTIAAACLEAGRTDPVTLVAVTKYHSIAEAQAVVATGMLDLAENRPDGLAQKQAALTAPELKWHFIGNLQKRKVKQVINQVTYLHSLDRVSLAAEIEKRAHKPIDCFVEVNVSGEAAKSGIELAEVDAFITALADFTKIRVIGLMTMAPIDADDVLLHELFKKLRLQRDAIVQRHLAYAPCRELSMGMSRDYRIAVLEGATFVRVGTALFQ
ncbi:YggS family pyridoxal phosphate-dependent enzyme [Loigolactobacillus zhaoyuanensis]|uniref:YggS family pyridoxal phosphate-dependent enzyme n=1 Tax=Loigolactobacillus zhaoyuanensis TaxID=2486017 RepID=UPI000F749E48|nr:YggS family pyridoxal phosphate-dependent enzyme [Loigolactobacillus zhaoyuanensis]